MTVTVTHTNGRPTYDWEQILYEALGNGTFGAPIGGNIEIRLTYNTYEIILTGDSLDTATPTSLSAGSITGVAIKDGDDVVSWADVDLDFNDINNWITYVVNDSGSTPSDTYYSDGFKSAVIYPLIDSAASEVSATGSGDADSIFGSAFADTLVGGSGNDYFQTRGASSGADTVTGGDDWNFLDLRPGAPVGGLTVNVTGGSDGEVLDAASNVIVNFTDIQGFALSDEDDTFNGGDNDEYIESFDGSDTINGGGGWDKLSFRFETGSNGIVVDVGLGTVTDTYGNTDVFENIEGFKGSGNDDTFNGSENDSTFEGMGGNDTFNGGAGSETVEYQWEYEVGGTGGITVDLSDVDIDGYATVNDTLGGTDKLKNIENIIGTGENDTITGNDADNYIAGLNGDDTINGGGGHDELRGQGGNDTIDGGDGDDKLRGGAGDDTITGGDGRDNINGNVGDDIISAGDGDDWINGSSIGVGTDTVDGGSGYDMMGFEKDFEDEFEAEYSLDGITVTLQAGANPGSGEITGFYGADINGDAGAVVNTTFENMEAIVGTWRDDTFVATNGGFENTENSDHSFFGVRGMGGVFDVTGGMMSR